MLSQADLEGVARIDRRHTGRDRRGYLCRTVAEALADSALRVSLAARIDGALAGYVMARLDYGDFGRAEPVAVIDTIGVDPLRAHQGVGRALLSQLFANLAALGVERVETVVAPGDLGLMGFFYAAGFRPSERLSFVKDSRFGQAGAMLSQPASAVSQTGRSAPRPASMLPCARRCEHPACAGDESSSRKTARGERSGPRAGRS